MIKGIVFDLDGVFFLNGTENFIKNVSEKFNVPKEKVIQFYKKSDEMNKFYKTGKWNGDQYWTWFIKELEIDSTKEELLELLSEGYIINQRALNLCRELKSKGYKTLICSNNFPERIEILDKKFDFLKEFDTIIFSFDVGILKPDNKIYKILCKKSGLKPEEVFLADDREKNVQSAKDFGIHAVFYDSFEEFINELNKLGVDVELDIESKQEIFEYSDKKKYKSYKKGWKRKYK